MIALFGVLMVCAAAVSERPWEPETTYRAGEAQLHSWVASAAGVAYTVGVGAVAFTDAEAPVWLRAFSLVVAISGVAFPAAMVGLPTVAGLLQRVMFALAYVWLLAESGWGIS